MVNQEEIEALTASFRRKGAFWRYLSLLQFPLALALTFYFITRYLGADTIVDVRETRTAAETGVSNIPEKEYVNVAQNIVNLIGTYQPVTARDQFEAAREYFLEPALPNFDELQMNGELNVAEQSEMSQILFVEHTQFTKSSGGKAKVCLYGVRQRIVEKSVLPQQDTTYCLTLQPDQPYEGNTFGLMVSEFTQRLGPARPAPMPQRVAPKFEKPKERKKPQIKRMKKIGE